MCTARTKPDERQTPSKNLASWRNFFFAAGLRVCGICEIWSKNAENGPQKKIIFVLDTLTRIVYDRRHQRRHVVVRARQQEDRR